MKLNRKKLQACLNSLSKLMVNNKKPIKPVYKNVQFYIESNILSFYATDGVHFINSTYGEIENENKSFMVEYETLNKLISLSEAEEINFDFQEDSIKIKSGKSKYKLQYFLGQDFKFFIDDIEAKEQTLVLTETIENIIKAVDFIYPVIKNGGDQNKFKGVYFDGNFVAADTAGMALYPIGKDEGKFFVNVDSFYLINSLEKEVIADIFITATTLIIKTSLNEIIMPMQVMEFPNYSNTVNKVNKYELSFTVEKQILIKACQRIKLFSDESIKQHGLFKIAENELTLSANSSNKEGEEIIETKEIKILDKTVEILVDLKRFTDYIVNIPSEEIILQFTDTLGKPSPLLVRGKNINSLFYIENSLLKRNLSLV